MKVVIQHLHVTCDEALMTERHQEIRYELREIQQQLEKTEGLVMALQDQIVELKTSVDALAKLAADNPTLADAINAVKAQADKVHNIIADAPVVPSVT